MTWFTYDAARRPVWLTTALNPISNNVWTSTLYRKRLVNGSVINEPELGVGEVAIRFLPNDPTRAAIRWRWADVGPSTYDECLTDFFRPGALSTLEGSQQTTSTNSFSGPTSINAGLVGPWDEPNNGGWSVSVTVNQVLNTNPPEYIESYAALIYDTAGYPVWVQGILDAGQVPFEMAVPKSVDLGYTSSTFPSAFPIDHCPQGCAQYEQQPVGQLTRSFVQELSPTPRIVMNVELRVGTPTPAVSPAQPLTSTGQTINWTRPLGGGSVGLTRQYGLRTDWILVDRYQCGIQPDQSYCNVVVNWSSSLQAARAFRRNLVTNQVTMIVPAGQSSAAPQGQSLQQLVQNDRVQYELHSSSTPTPSTLLYRTPEVRALNVVAATPPSPDATTAPPLDPASDAVGATAGSFRVDESGAATYSIPLLLPPGRGGTTPAISLAYSSAGGDGALGIGWSIAGQSMINRCRRSREAGDGDAYQYPGIYPYGGTDAYCLDGLRLIQVPNGRAHGTAGAEYRTEIDSFQRIIVETATTIVEGSGTPTPQPLTWLVRGRDGVIRRFGETENGLDGRVLLKNAPPATITNDLILAWAETTRSDTVGNSISFDYTSDVLDSSSPLGEMAEHRLTEIRYIGGRIVFNYTLRASGSWGDGPVDRKYVGGAALASRARLLSSVQVFAARCRTNPAVGTAPNCDGATDASPFRTYNLTYGRTPLNPSRERLESVQECGKAGVCFAPTTFSWSQPSSLTALTQFGETESVRRFGNLTSMKFGDFNGDGRTDIYWTDSPSGSRTLRIAVSTSDAGRFLFTPVEGTGIRISGRNQLDRNWHVLDFNADGLDDVVFIRDCDGVPGCVAGWHVALAQPVAAWTSTNNLPPIPAPGTSPLTYQAAFTAPLTGIVEGQSTATSIPLDATNDLNFGGLLADVNGDGLLDLVYSSGALFGGGYGLQVRVLARHTGANRPYIFAPSSVPLRLVGTNNEICAPALFDRHNIERFEVHDFNGDGVGDLKLRTSRASCTTNVEVEALPPSDVPGSPVEEDPCSVNACTTPIDPIGTGSTGTTVGSEPLNSSTSNAHFWTLFTNEGVRDGAFHFRANPSSERWLIAGSWVPGANGAQAHRYQVDDDPEAFQTAEINGDGYTDVLYRKPGGSEWIVQLNKGLPGVAQFNAGQCVVPSSGAATASDAWTVGACRAPQASGSEAAQRKFTTLADIDEDGRLDFVFSEAASPNRLYWVLPWTGSRFASRSGAIATSFAPRGDSETSTEDRWLRSFVDLDGDGAVELFQVRPNFDDQSNSPHGAWSMHRLPDTVRGSVRNAIASITDGLGAQTLIEYLPMTVAQVYRRDHNGAYIAAMGRGAPIFDVLSPTWLVATVQSSAPTKASATARSQIEYRYQGLKAQSGGRGTLGFRRVLTYDIHSGIETVTSYRQDYPFTGVPVSTVSRRVISSPLPVCASAGQSPVVSQACYVPAPRCTAGAELVCDTVWEEGRTLRTLTAATDTWGFRYSAPASFAPSNADEQAPASVGTTEQTSTPSLAHRPIGLFKLAAKTTSYDWASGTAIGTVEVENVTDDYGHLIRSKQTTYEGATSTIVHRKTSAFFHSYTPFISGVGTEQLSDDKWLLGRLSRTRVIEERRRDGALVTGTARWASFSYDQTSGQLVWERTQDASSAGDFLSARFSTHHQYDEFGNRTQSTTCTPDVGEQACAQTTVSTVSMAPSTNTRIHRYRRTIYDALGRFPVATVGPFFSASNAAVERSAETIRGWNEVGEPSTIEGINGETTTVVYGSMLREWFRKSNTGPWAQAVHMRCTAPGQFPFCPSQAAVRVENRQGGSATTWMYMDVLGRPQLMLRQHDATRFVAVRTHYDALGRTVEVTEPYFASGPSVAGAGNATQGVFSTVTSFDGLSRPTSVTRPDGGVVSYSYQGLTTTQTLPANGSQEIQTLTETRDAAGMVSSSTDANAWTQDFEYFPTGELAEVSRTLPGASSPTRTTMTYDVLGHRIGLIDPDAGSYTYVVNALGEVIEESASGACTRTVRDAQGRMIERFDFAGSCGSTVSQYSSWSYDTAPQGVGQVAFEASSRSAPPNATTTQIVGRGFVYDAFGRVSSVMTMTSPRILQDDITYDAFSRPFQRFHKPALTDFRQMGEQVTFDAYGRVNKVTDAYPSVTIPVPVEFYRVTDYSPRGQVATLRYGDSFNVTRGYQASTGRVASIVADGGRLQNHSYTYDLIGNVRQRVDMPSALDIDPQANPNGTDAPTVSRYVREVFGYDRLQRLTSQDVYNSTGLTPDARDTFEYDGGVNVAGPGRMSQRTAHGAYTHGTKATGCTLSGEVTPGPHALTAGAVMGGATQYCYDARGNQTRAIVFGNTARDVTYTPFNLPATIRSVQSGRRSTFLYGPNRELVLRYDYLINDPDSSPRRTTIYAGSTEFHSFADGRRMVKRMVPDAPGVFRQQEGFTVAGFTGTVYQDYSHYVLTDALGSTHAVVAGDRRAAGRTNGERMLAAQSFNPWGFRRTTNGRSTLPWATVGSLEYAFHTRSGFTGHESADLAGLIHMRGRLYDPAVGRFMSPDPVVQAPHDGQNYNRYAYAFNNPLAYTDPTGHWSRKHQQYLRTAIAIAITAYTGNVLATIKDAGAATFFGVNVTQANVLAVKMVGGFASGAVQSGDLKGGLAGAFSAGLFHGIGQSLDPGLGKVAAHGFAGGIMAELQGGKFGHGFVSAGVTEALSPEIMKLNGGAFEETMAAAVVGGTASALSGGKFANGAVTAAFQVAFNHLLEKQPPYSPEELDPAAARFGIGTVRITTGDFQQIADKHGPNTNRVKTSTFNADLVKDYGSFIDHVLEPALAPGGAPVSILPSPNQKNILWRQVRWERDLGSVVGYTLDGVPTTRVRIELQYDFGSSNVDLLGGGLGSVWRVMGVYPVPQRMAP